MNPMTPAEAALHVASEAYYKARGDLSDAMLGIIPETVHKLFPTATKLVTESDYSESGIPILRCQSVHDADGIIASVEHDEDRDDATGEAIDELVEELDSHLDWLCELNGDDYVSADPITFDVTADKAIPSWGLA